MTAVLLPDPKVNTERTADVAVPGPLGDGGCRATAAAAGAGPAMVEFADTCGTESLETGTDPFLIDTEECSMEERGNSTEAPQFGQITEIVLCDPGSVNDGD